MSGGMEKGRGIWYLAASSAMAEEMSDAVTFAPMPARGMASEPTPHPASQKLDPAAAVPSSCTHLRTWG